MKEKEIVMPHIVKGDKSVILCAWLKEEGDEVKAGEPLFEIETEKVVTQVEATENGILKRIIVDEGDEVTLDAPVAIIEEE